MTSSAAARDDRPDSRALRAWQRRCTASRGGRKRVRRQGDSLTGSTCCSTWVWIGGLLRCGVLVLLLGSWVDPRERVGAGDQALRPRRCRRGASSRSTARRATRRAAVARLALRPVALAATRCVKVPADRSCSPARSRSSSPPTARAIPTERVLGREVACDNFQDAEALPARRRRARPPARVPDRGHVPHQPGAVRGRDAGEREQLRHRSRSDLHVYQIPARSRRHRDRCSTASRSRPAISPARSSPATTASSAARRSSTRGGCRGLQEEVLLSGSWNLNPWFVRVELVPLTEIPIGYVGVVVSYVGKEHLDVSGDAFTHGDLVERGRKGVWVEPLLPGKHPLNTRVMKVELVPTTNIVLNWAQRTEAHQYDAAAVVDPRALEGRLLVQPRRGADHPHRHEERAARDLARRVDAEPGRPRAAADGRQLLPQLGAGGDGARVPVGALGAPAGGVREHPARRSRRTTSSASTR